MALTKVKCYWTKKLNWSFLGWVKNIEIYDRRTLIQIPDQPLLLTNAFSQVGGSLGRNENWRDMDSAGEDAHKRTGTSSIKTSSGNLFKSTGDKVSAYAHSDGQCSGPDLLSENGAKKIYKWFVFPNKFGNCY